MRVTRLVRLLAILAMLPPQLAAAQTQDGGAIGLTAGVPSGAVHLTLPPATTGPVPSNAALGERFTEALFKASPAIATAAQPGTRSSGARRGYAFRGFIGLWVGSGEGLVLGGGVSALPLDDARHEIAGNVSYLRIEGYNGFSVDVNYLYNFDRQGRGRGFTPYVGAGINVADIADDSEAALQLGGGIRWLTAGNRQLFVEGFFPFYYDTPLIARFGFAW